MNEWINMDITALLTQWCPKRMCLWLYSFRILLCPSVSHVSCTHPFLSRVSHLLTVSMGYTAVLQMETRSSWPLAQTWELGLALITFISLPSNLKATNSVFLCKSFQHNGIFLTMMITNGHSKHLSVRTAWHHLQTMLLLLVLALYQVDNLMTLWSHCGCTTQTVPLSRN